MGCVLFPPRYFAPVGYYAVMWAAGRCVYDTGARYDKRCKAVHRMDIADTHGVMSLTVPVSKGDCASGTRPRWRDRTVSDHGRWWDVHRVTLESAYGRTPFFEFYIDRLLPYLSRESVGRPIVELDVDLDCEVRRMLHMPSEVYRSDDAPLSDATVDYDHIILPDTPEYWQIRADRFGFIPGLSILDLLFNMGPESQYIIKKMADKIIIP